MPFELKDNPDLRGRAKSVPIAGVERFIYPLNLRQTVRLAEMGNAPPLNAGSEEAPKLNTAALDFYVAAAVVAFSRAYPGVAAQDFWDDEVAIEELQRAYIEAISLAPVERVPEGERPAASPSGISTGESSSPPSS